MSVICASISTNKSEAKNTINQVEMHAVSPIKYGKPVNQTLSGYVDLAEISTPSNPSANIARVYCRDEAGSTRVYFRDSAGAETQMGGGASSGITVGTPQATTSGTAFDFTSLPAGIKRLTILFNQVSLSGTSDLLIQIGDSGGLETTGYTSSSTNDGGVSSSTIGFVMRSQLAARQWSGKMTIERIDGNEWVASHALGSSVGPFAIAGGGAKTLSADLDRLRLLVAAGGADTFDNGKVNILYEL